MQETRPSKFDDEIPKRLIELCFTQTSFTPYFALPASIMPVLFLWEHYDRDLIISWLLIVWLVYLVAFPGVAYIYKHLIEPDKHQHIAKFLILILPVLAGGSWGISSLFLFDAASFSHQSILLAFIIGISSVTAIVYTAYHPYFVISSTAMLGPFIYRYFIVDEFTHYVIAAYLFFFLIALHILNKRNSNNLQNMLYLQLSMQEQKDIAETAKQAQTNFFAAASHDLRQPLHVQGLLVSSLRNKIKQDEQLKTLDMLEQSMKGVQNLLNALLDFSKLDADALQPEYRNFHLRDLFERIFLQIEPQASEKRLTFSIRPIDVVLYSDELLLERILRNLVNNAIQYTESGSVLLAARRRKDKVLIEVRDSGPGIAKHEQKRVFQEFMQTKTNKIRNTPGLGLGLAIVKRLSILLDIELNLNSAPGKGSNFSLLLPISEQQSLPQASEQKTAFTKNDALTGVEILLVDDNEMILHSMNQVLQEWGCKIQTASNGIEALDLLQQGFKPDLAIIDYRLEGETGIEIYNSINKKLASKAPVIIMTGDTAADKLHEFQHQHCIVVHKPVPVDKLYELISSLAPKK